jgi:hypothetical protein
MPWLGGIVMTKQGRSPAEGSGAVHRIEPAQAGSSASRVRLLLSLARAVSLPPAECDCLYEQRHVLARVIALAALEGRVELLRRTLDCRP